MYLLLVLAVLLAGLSLPATAMPPANADPKMKQFYEGLRSMEWPGIPCCGVNDCRPVESRSPINSPSGHWEAFIDKASFGESAPNEWVVVPDNMVDDKPSLFPRPERAVACWVSFNGYYQGPHLYCFRTPDTAI